MNYLIKSGNYLKIGFANNFKRRLTNYYTHNPDFQVIDTFAEGTLETENTMHKQLKDLKYKGEWYKYDPKVLNIWNAITKHEINCNPPDFTISNQIVDAEEIIKILTEQYSVVITSYGLQKLGQIQDIETIKLFFFLLKKANNGEVIYNSDLKFELRTKAGIHVSKLSEYIRKLQDLNLLSVNKRKLLINSDFVKR